MGVWTQRALFLNIILLLLFVIADYLTWIYAPEPIVMEMFVGTIEDASVGASYSLLSRRLWIRGIRRYNGVSTSFTETSDTLNFPLLILLASLALNVYLVSKLERKKKEG